MIFFAVVPTVISMIHVGLLTYVTGREFLDKIMTGWYIGKR